MVVEFFPGSSKSEEMYGPLGKLQNVLRRNCWLFKDIKEAVTEE